MKRFLYNMLLPLVGAVLFASCIESDDNEFVLYDDVAITSFKISSSKILTHTTSSTGGDSTYYATSTAVSAVPFSIDHVNGEIYNPDSLPYGTNPKNLLCEYTAKNNAVVGLESLVGDSVSYLTTTDSVDFSQPRYVRVYSSDNQTTRRYKITVNIHKEQGDLFQWKKMASVSAFASMDNVKTVVFGGNIWAFGVENGQTVSYMSGIADGSNWVKSANAFGPEAYANVVAAGSRLLVLDGSILKESADGLTFTEVAVASNLSRLIGASTTELYAIATDGSLMLSKDGGLSWSADKCDDELEKLPVQDISYTCSAFGYVGDTDYAVMVGNRSVTAYPDEKHAMVWRKVVEHSADRAGQWSLIEFDGSMYFPLPRLANLALFSYGSSLMAFGGAGIGGCTEEAFKNVYESRDGGITWKVSKTVILDSAFDKNATSLSVVADENNYIWIVCCGTGEVWRGRLNKMGWDNYK